MKIMKEIKGLINITLEEYDEYSDKQLKKVN